MYEHTFCMNPWDSLGSPGVRLTEKINDAQGPKGRTFYQNFLFWWFWGVRVGLGPSPIDAGWKNTPGLLFSWDLVGVMKVSCRFFDFWWLARIRIFHGFKVIFRNIGIWAHNTPLKRALADAACKVSMIFFNIASGLCCEMHNGYSSFFDFHDFQ